MTEDEETPNNVRSLDDHRELPEWSTNIYEAAYAYVESLVQEDGGIAEVFPFVPGIIETEPAFEVISRKLQETYSENEDEAVRNIISVACLAFMMGAWVGSAQDSPAGFTVTLTKDQINQVVGFWVAEKMEEE